MSKDIVFVIANKKSEAFAGREGTILFTDCTVSIEQQFDNDITEHPIDGDANIVDHIVNKNMTLRFTGIYNVHTLVRYTGDSVPSQNRVAEAYNRLVALRNDKVRFSVVSRYDVHSDMVVKSLSIPVAADDGNSLIFNMELQQVRASKPFNPIPLVRTEDISQPFVDSAAIKVQSGNKQKTRTSALPIVNQLDMLENGGG